MMRNKYVSKPSRGLTWPYRSRITMPIQCRGEQRVYGGQKARRSNKQLSLRYNDVTGTRQVRAWMKDRGEAPPTRLLYVPLHAAEFNEPTMWAEIKAPVSGGFPLLACCLNMTAGVFEYCTDAWLRAFSRQASDRRSCPLSTRRLNFLFTSMLVKRYTQR